MKNQNEKRTRWILSLKHVLMLLPMLYLSCGKDDATDTSEFIVSPDGDVLVQAERIAKVSSQEVSVILNQPQFIDVEASTLNELDIYRVVYRTNDVAGNMVLASSLAMVPLQTAQPPILSYQHGTIISQSEAPSAFDRSKSLMDILLVFASSGYVVSAPDYLGYGESSILDHPFEHGPTMGSSTFDALLASRELLQLLNVDFSDKLFLAGYSQGGYATMALHQHLEENSELQVTMSAPGAGAYNKSGTVAELEGLDIKIDNPGAWLWNIHVINTTSGLNRSWSSIVTPENATILESVSNPFVYPTLTTLDNEPDALFNESFVDGLRDGTDVDFLQALQLHDNFDWSPRNPITLYYGTADNSVPSFHAVTAHEAIKERGSAIEIVAYKGGTHTSSVGLYWADIFELFNAMK